MKAPFWRYQTCPMKMLRTPILTESAVTVSKNPEHHGRMKHLDLWFYWLRDAVDQGIIAPLHIPGTEQPADILTKALPLPKAQFCRKAMGVSDG